MVSVAGRFRLIDVPYVLILRTVKTFHCRHFYVMSRFPKENDTWKGSEVDGMESFGLLLTIFVINSTTRESKKKK